MNQRVSSCFEAIISGFILTSLTISLVICVSCYEIRCSKHQGQWWYMKYSQLSSQNKFFSSICNSMMLLYLNLFAFQKWSVFLNVKKNKLPNSFFLYMNFWANFLREIHWNFSHISLFLKRKFILAFFLVTENISIKLQQFPSIVNSEYLFWQFCAWLELFYFLPQIKKISIIM